jgi:hypothetical protein
MGADATTCNGNTAGAASCKTASCGDGYVNAMATEQCEPPNTPTCDATCKTI